jgi:N-acetylglucosaminyl-diphospho-decaprenol L-rhamnosyltransferase
VIPRRADPSRTVDYVLGACFLMPRVALETVGPLDDRFFLYFEETDWCWRACRGGLDVWYCAETEITHLEGRSAEQASAFSLRQFQLSYRLFVAKNYGRGRVWGYRLAQFAEYGLKALLRRLARGERNRRLAAVYWERARLQFARRIEVAPPS